VLLHDPTQDVSFERSGDDLNDGLYVELRGWGWHLFHVAAAPNDRSDAGHTTSTTDDEGT
jgi:hypothetical protein